MLRELSCSHLGTFEQVHAVKDVALVGVQALVFVAALIVDLLSILGSPHSRHSTVLCLLITQT